MWSLRTSSWKRTSIGPFSSNALAAYMKRASTEPPPEIDALFHFYHADLGPTNIMVSADDGVITAIIDWELAAYHPRV